jgi:spore germination cell wall hydrolase CwlJ-like protein
MFSAFRAAGFAAAITLLVAMSWSQPVLAADLPSPAVAAFQQAIVQGEAPSLTPGFSAPAPLGLNETAPAPAPPHLAALVSSHAGDDTLNEEQDCLANAVYFEARGEPLEGQLAVAEVVLNRSRSGRYPPTVCGVVTQRAQFSFVRRGVIPRADRASEAWRRAVGIARVAQARAMRLLSDNVLWYHATYVSPSWGRRLARTTQIGLHIFYS